MSISGVGVSATRAGADPESVLMLIHQGGEPFMQRMKALGEVKTAAIAALADLDLGKEVTAAYAEATAKHAEALSVLDQANTDAKQILERAKIEAAGAIQNANSEYERIVKEAKAQHEEATKKHSAATDVLAAAKAEASRLTSEVRAIREQAAIELDLIKKKTADMDAAKVAHDAAKAKTDELVRSLNSKMEALHKAIERARE